MKKAMKRIAALALAAVLTFGTAVTSMAATESPTTGKKPVTQDNVKSEDNIYTTKTYRKGWMRIKSAKAVNKKKVAIPETMTINGITYRVTSLGAGSLKKWKKVKTIVLSKNVDTVHGYTFKNCKKLRTIIVKNTQPINFYKRAFKGVDTKKLTIKFSKNMSKKDFKKTKKRLRKIGFKGKIERA